MPVHDAHLSPHLANVLLDLGGQGVEGVRLVGEDGPRDSFKFGREVVIHLAS